MTTKLQHKDYGELTLVLCSECLEWARTTIKLPDYHKYFSQADCEACEVEREEQ